LTVTRARVQKVKSEGGEEHCLLKMNRLEKTFEK